jgi:hypothetical protein
MGIGINRTLRHHPMEYFERAAIYLRGIHRVNLTGGEPTSHPQFAAMVPHFRRMFDCQELTMITNGYRVHQYEDLIVGAFDYIAFTDYEDRREALESISRRMRVSARHEGVNGSLFVLRSSQGGGNPCTRHCAQSFGCAYADGKFWGCCVAPGLDGAVPLEPSSDWRERLLATPGVPCSTCFFSE